MVRPNTRLAAVAALLAFTVGLAAVAGFGSAAGLADLGQNQLGAQNTTDTPTDGDDGTATPDGVSDNDTAADNETADENQTDGGLDEAALPPGVSANGTVDLEALVDAHRSVLLEEGYRSTANLDLRLNGSSFLTVDASNDASANGTTSVQVDFSLAGKTAQVSVWENETHKVVRMQRDGNESFIVLPSGSQGMADGDGPMGPPGDGPMGPPGDGPMAGDNGMSMGMSHGSMAGHASVPGKELLALADVTGEFTVRAANESDLDTVSMVQDGEANDTERQFVVLTAPIELDDLEGDFDGSVRLLADDRGVIHAADVGLQSTEYGINVTHTLNVDELGVEELEAPAWLDEVPANATVGPVDRPEPDEVETPEVETPEEETPEVETPGVETGGNDTATPTGPDIDLDL